MADLHTCRLCGQWKEDRHTGPMFKYSVRHYAHARCGVVRWGREWLDKEPDWIIKQFPYFLAKELGILDYLRGRRAPKKPHCATCNDTRIIPSPAGCRPASWPCPNCDAAVDFVAEARKG